MSSPATLVTVEDVKAQIRVTDNDSDDELYYMLSDAQDIVITFMGERFDAEWTIDTVPGAVRSAILRQTAYFWAHRGDEDDPKVDESGLAPGIRWLLQANGYRDLTIG